MLGTLNNCASGMTPWGTYLTGEENFTFYFDGRRQQPTRTSSAGGCAKARGYRWHEHDERFDASQHPNEPNRFGWIVEIDPFDPRARRRSSAPRSAAPRTKAPGSR